MNAVDTAVSGELTHHQPVFTTADVIKTTGGSPGSGRPNHFRPWQSEGLIAKVLTVDFGQCSVHADFSPYAIIPQLRCAPQKEKRS